jgi:FecR protein
VKYLCLLIVMMTTVALMAADPVGRVTSSGPLTLNGKALPATAVSSLPLVAGDEIATSSTSATIYFSDKSRATLDPNSRVKLEFSGSAETLRVLSGSVDLNRAKDSRLTVFQQNRSEGHDPHHDGDHHGSGSDHHPCKDHKPSPRSEHHPGDHDCD